MILPLRCVVNRKEFPAGPGATESIFIEQQYILERGPRTTELLQALAARAAEVDIRIIVSSTFRKVGAKDS